MNKADKKLRLTTKLLLWIIISAIICISVFSFAYGFRLHVGKLASNIFGKDSQLEERAMRYTSEQINRLSTTCKNDVCSTTGIATNDLERIMNKTVNKYSPLTIYAYGENDEYVYEATSRGILYTLVSQTMYFDYSIIQIVPNDLSIKLVDNQGVEYNATVAYFNHSIQNYAFIYVSFLLVASILLFIWMIYMYMKYKIRYIQEIGQSISVIESGNLDTLVPVESHDELSELAIQLNNMRQVLKENIDSEKEVRQANNELITNMSHDLRTPLTTLQGTLEILKLKKFQGEEYDKYLDRCLDRVKQIDNLSSKMFQYFLVYASDEETPDKELMSLEEVEEILNNYIQDIEMKGFKVKTFFINANQSIDVSKQMLQRVFDNIFGNIVKYASADIPLVVHMDIERSKLKMMFSNTKVKKDEQESTGIGIRSVEKILQLHGGSHEVLEDEERYTIVISIPLKKSK